MAGKEVLHGKWLGGKEVVSVQFVYRICLQFRANLLT